VRERAVPVPAATFEAIYTPVSGSAQGRSAPPDVVQYQNVLGKHELALRRHLEQYQRVPCHVQAPPPGGCTPGPLIIQVPPFDPNRVVEDAADVGPRGCARIEAARDDLPEIGTHSGALPEQIRFDAASAVLSAEARALADAVAARIAKNPAFECVAVVGQIATDESPTIAAERARTVQDHLVARGVDPLRLTIVTVTQRVYGAGSRPGEVDPSLRRVTFRVQLYDASRAAP
jgi:outer membrane protein OmpA-like peptidoglycan-associated protein